MLAGLLLAALGCGAGFDATTSQPYTPSEGVDGDAGTVLLRGVTLVAPGPGGPAGLVGGLVNEGKAPDTLTSVQVLGSSQPGYFPQGQILLPPGELVPLGLENSPSVTVTGPPTQLRAGNFVSVRFVFENAGSTTLQLLVQPRKGDYATVTPTPQPTAEPTQDGGQGSNL